MKYNNDPKWITAKFDSKCHGCEESILKEDDIFYYPLDKSVFCESCGEAESYSFESIKQDDQFIQDQFPDSESMF